MTSDNSIIADNEINVNSENKKNKVFFLYNIATKNHIKAEVSDFCYCTTRRAIAKAKNQQHHIKKASRTESGENGESGKVVEKVEK